MRNLLLAAAATLIVGAVGTGALIRGAEAQRAADAVAVETVAPGATADVGWVDPDLVPGDEMELAQANLPPPGPPGPPGPPPEMGRRMPPPGMGMAGGPGWHHMRGRMWQTFALFFHPDDRALTAPEVQKIAEAFLLWNGNRTWKVTEVAAAPDNQVTFAYATADGGVIARFTMDTRTGRVRRLG